MIGITGTISSGKSLVSDYLRKCGFRVIDADQLAQAELSNKDIINALVQRYGKDIVSNNEINRKKLGEIVFHSKEDRFFLNHLIHPRVIAKIKEFKKIDDILFVEVPLLYEVGIEKMFDKIIVVYADYQTALKRLMKRDNISQEYAHKKITSQLDIEEKRKRADYVIDNRGDIENTYHPLKTLLRRLI